MPIINRREAILEKLCPICNCELELRYWKDLRTGEVSAKHEYCPKCGQIIVNIVEDNAFTG
jgi:Zn-finger nucleic acid-binding protein